MPGADRSVVDKNYVSLKHLTFALSLVFDHLIIYKKKIQMFSIILIWSLDLLTFDLSDYL